jgi:hypothetical protein
MLLASNKQQQKEKTQNRNTQQRRLNTQKRTARKTIDQVGKFQEAPHLQDYTKSFGILQMLKFQNRKISLVSNPLILFDRIFRGYRLFFRRTLRLTI